MINEDRVQEVYDLVGSFCKKYNIYSEEMVQDLTWKVWQQLDRLYDEKKSKLSTYVYLCCKHYYLNEKRKKSVKCVSLNEEVGDGVEYMDTFEDDGRDPLEELIHKENLAKLAKIYETCSPMLRNYLDGKKQTEIAKELGISQPHVSRRIKREIEKIRKKVIK